MRVVSLSPVATEVVVDLGLGHRLVALDAASARVRGADGIPVTEPAGVGAYSPDLVLSPASEAVRVRRAAPGGEVVEVAPHDFDEAWDLYRTIGAALGRRAEARRYVREISRPLAELGARSFGQRRPRVVAILTLSPLEIAGDHSFVTDLIELAGGETVGHGAEQLRLRWSAEQITAAKPELALVVSAQEPVPGDIALARTLLGPAIRIEPLVLDLDRFWVHDALPAAERLHTLLDELRAADPEPH